MVRKPKRLRDLKETDGAAMVEFALIIILLLIILLGVIQFGLMFYTKYAIACASREGARYGVLYQVDSSNKRILPNALNPSINTVVRNYITKLCSSVDQAYVTVNISGTAYTTGTPGTQLIVRVTCQNPWDLLSGFLPFLKNKTFTAETTMLCE